MSSSPPVELVNAFLREIQRGSLPDVQALQRLHGFPETWPLDAFLACSNKHGDTALLVAAREGHVTLLQTLHEQYGLSLEQRNADGKTALHEAAQSGQLVSIHYLLGQGAQPDPLKRADWWVWQ